MRIAYGVMGYGRGHSSRALAVLPSLMGEHEITVFAGGDAYSMLASRFPTVKIETLGYAHGRGGGVSFAATMIRNAGLTSDLLLGGGSMQQVLREFRTRGIELVISDSEAWTHQAARRIGIPRIGFDHVGVIAYCKPHFPQELSWQGIRDGWGYRQLMGLPDRTIISSFYPAQPLQVSSRMVGSILRPEVHHVRSTRGTHLVAYFNRGHLQFTADIERTLRLIDMPVIIYGTPHLGQSQNLTFRAIDPVQFLEDVASSHAVIATAGNQLIGELLHLRKPLLALPERVFEQRLNAWMVERMGIGRAASLKALTADDVEVFLGEVPACAARMEGYATDGLADAIAALRQFIDELGTRRNQAKSLRTFRSAATSWSTSSRPL
jgi:uncharacterized protein (TIGR00661 family)